MRNQFCLLSLGSSIRFGDAVTIWQAFPPEKRVLARVCFVPGIIKNGEDFGNALRNLNVEQCTIVCEALKDKLPDIIKNGDDFVSTLRNLNAEQCTIVCETLKNKLPDIFKSGDDFVSTLRNLNVEQCTIVCNAVKDKLPDSVENNNAIRYALKHLDSRAHKAVCDVFQDRLRHLDTYSWVTNFLSNLVVVPTLTWTTQQSHNDVRPDLFEDWSADNEGQSYHIASASKTHLGKRKPPGDNYLPEGYDEGAHQHKKRKYQ